VEAAAEDRADQAATKAWIESLFDEFPDLRPIYEEHMASYHGLLAHLLFGDVVRWIEGVYTAGDYATIRAFIDRIERDYPTLGPRAGNVVDVSFAEDLPFSGTPGGLIAQWLGPNLRREYLRGHHLRESRTLWREQGRGPLRAPCTWFLLNSTPCGIAWRIRGVMGDRRQLTTESTLGRTGGTRLGRPKGSREPRGGTQFHPWN
jgi:hypothetical protein